MNVFILQHIVESRCFVRVLRDEAGIARSFLAQVNAMIAKMEAMNDQEEYYDSLRSLRDSRRIENDKLIGLNELIAQAEEDIFTNESHLEIKEASIKGFNGLTVPQVLVVVSHRSQILTIEIGSRSSALSFGSEKNLTEVAESSRLPDKMKVVFDRARSEEKYFARLMQDLCFSLRISLSKKRRLVAELETLVERGDAASPLEHMREIVAHDSVTLGDLEKLLAHAQVGVSLKDGYVADIEEKE
ncbi:hypothetical protein Tco_1476446 [Tanacetum coccineum]